MQARWSGLMETICVVYRGIDQRMLQRYIRKCGALEFRAEPL